MNFETKFNLKEHAWYMKDNNPTEVVIASIQIFHVGTNQDHIKYTAKHLTGSVSWLDHQNLFESMLFKSKHALLESLFGGGTTCKGENCSAVNGVGHSKECIKEHDAACSMEAPEIPGFAGTKEALHKLST